MKMRPVSLSRRALLAAPGLALPAAQAAAQGASLVQVGRDGWLFPIWDNIERVDLTSLRNALQTLGQAITILRGARIDVVMCLIPSRNRIMRQYLPTSIRVSPDAEKRYSMTLTEVRRVGGLAPDLDAKFRETMTREPTRTLFFKTDTHWTPVGAEIAAVEIARQMRENLRLPPSPRPGIRLGDLQPMNIAGGDLPRLLPAPQRAPYGAEHSLLRTVLPAEGAAALLEDDSYDTVVVGTSNVQPRFGFQPVLSNQLVRPVGLSWRPNNIGPYTALLEYLRSQAFRAARPKALVWNHLEMDMLNATNNPSWGANGLSPANYLAELRRLVG